MTDSLRKDIIEGLQTRLQAILVSSGYRRTITTVDFAAKDWSEVSDDERDFIGIVPQRETLSDHPSHIQSNWSIDLVCHLTPSAATSAAIMQANVDLMTDVRRTLCTAPANLGVEGVHYVRVASRAGTEGDPAAVAQGVASTVIGLEVVFEEGLTDT